MTISDDLNTALARLDSAEAQLVTADTAVANATTAVHAARSTYDAALAQTRTAIEEALAALTPGPTGPTGPSGPTGPGPTGPGPIPGAPLGAPSGVTFKLALGDEFQNPTLDTAKWVTAGSFEGDRGRGNKGNGQQEWMTDAPSPNYVFANGQLTLRAKRESVQSGYAWSSGQIVSRQAFTEGWIECRCQMGAVKGACDAFWTWGAPGTNVAQQEVDCFECYTDRTTHIVSTNHASGGGGTGFIQPDGDLAAGFHTYGADIRANGIDWYFDGKKTGGVTGHPTQAWNVIAYLTVNGQMSNGSLRAPLPDAATNSMDFVLDYVRVYTRA